MMGFKYFNALILRRGQRIPVSLWNDQAGPPPPGLLVELVQRGVIEGGTIGIVMLGKGPRRGSVERFLDTITAFDGVVLCVHRQRDYDAWKTWLLERGSGVMPPSGTG